MTKKKPDKVEPKRSARKKFDIPIHPEIEAWSKKLFHPVKPFIDGLKEHGGKPERSEFNSEGENSAAIANLEFSQSGDRDAEKLSATEIILFWAHFQSK